MEHIRRDPVPEQLHGRSLAIGSIDTRTTELKYFPLMGHKRRDVIFVGGIEPAKTPRRSSPKQPVGSNNWVATSNVSMVEDEQVIAVIIESVEIAPSPQHLRQWSRSQPLIEYPITQCLYCVDVGGRFRESNLKRTQS